MAVTDMELGLLRQAEPTERIAEYYVQHKRQLYSFFLRKLGNARDAEDALHEAFIRLIDARRDRELSNPLAMLFCIAMNIVRDGVRKKRFRMKQTEGICEPFCMVSPEPDPESVAVAKQRLRIIQAAIEDLPPRCRAVFVLHKMEGRTHSEIAQELGISRNMVEKHIIRAYIQLRSALTHSEGGSADGAI